MTIACSPILIVLAQTATLLMPIRPENMKRYPGGSIHSPEWKAIVAEITERSGGYCEGWRAGVYPDCRAADGRQHPITGGMVKLTVAHLDHQPENVDRENLAHLCNRCHNTFDAPHRQANAQTRRERERRRHADHEQGQLFDTEPTRGIL